MLSPLRSREIQNVPAGGQADLQTKRGQIVACRGLHTGRHRYEFNNDYREALTSEGLQITGTSPDGRLVEIVEIKDQPWFLGCQFHPEFKSRPTDPHPLFRDFIRAAVAYRAGKT